MDGTLSTNPPTSLSSRPRLTPGIPAGGIAAIVVALGIMGWGLLAGDDGDSGKGHGFHVEFGDDHAPAPPKPPKPPRAPEAPRAPGANVHVNVDVDADEIERAVRDAMRDVDLDSTRMQGLREAREGLAEARRELAEARERLRAEGKEVPAIADGALKMAEMGVAAASGAAQGALISNGTDGSFTQTYEAGRGVQLVNFGGDVTIQRSSRAEKVKVEVEGGGNAMTAEVKDGVLTLRGNGDPHTGHGSITLTMPTDGDLTIAGLAGDLSIDGRSDGKLSVQLLRGDVSAERVGALSVDILESGSVSVERVDGPLQFSVAGSGDLSVERAERATIEVKGHANVSLGRVNDGLTMAILGHGELDIGRVNGPVKLDFPGAGRVSIGEGEAEPLQATVTGAGTFEFNGTAHDPRVVASGAGNVHIAHHEGNAQVRNTGVGTTYVGE